MAKHLPVPPELEHLIEKREDAERRTLQRRQQAEQRSLDLGPAGAAESAEELDDIPEQDRRSDQPPRRRKEARRMARRSSDRGE